MGVRAGRVAAVREVGARRAVCAALAMLWAVGAMALGPGPALGHEQHNHESGHESGHDSGQAGAAQPAESADALAGAAAEPFPVDIGGDFALVDQTGKAVTDADFRGRFMLIFFGYAQCDSICPVGLKRMTQAVDLLGERGERVQPILITVDPENDTPEALAAYVPTIHPRLLGLTGAPEAVAAAMKSYKVSAKPMGESWKGTPVISHGSYIYLMGPDGELLTILPPVFSSEAMAGIIARYLG
jgi:protein SCO1/2